MSFRQSKCIFCCQSLLPPHFSSLEVLPGSNGSERLNEILIIYFISKKLLKFSDKKCLQIVEACRKYSGTGTAAELLWRMCGSCEEIVNRALGYHLKIMSLQEQINVLGEVLSRIVNEEAAADDNNYPLLTGLEEDCQDGGFENIRNLIRRNLIVQRKGMLTVKAEPCQEFEQMDFGDNDFCAADVADLGIDSNEETSTTIKAKDRKGRQVSSKSKKNNYSPSSSKLKGRKRKLAKAMAQNRKRKNGTNTSNAEKGFRCHLCSKAFCFNNSFKRHLKIHEDSDRIGNAFDCPQCKFPNLTELALRKHLTIVHTKNAYKHTCDICGHVSDRPGRLERHMREKHNNASRTPVEATEEVPEVESFSASAQVQDQPVEVEAVEFGPCKTKRQRPKRNSSSTSTGNILDQDLLDDDDDDDLADNNAEDDEWRPSSDLEEDEKHISERPPLKNALEGDDHEVDNGPADEKQERGFKNSTRKYSCARCNLSWNCPSSLRRHKRDHRLSIKLNHKFDCDQCGYPANSENKLEYHKKRRHQGLSVKDFGTGKGKKKYECTLCPAKYTGSSGMRRHLRDHKWSRETGSQFECKLCNFPCRTEADLLGHKVRLHGDPGIVECKICKGNVNRKHMTDHLVVHKRYDRLMDPSTGEYKCPACPFVSPNIRGFIVHKNQKHAELNFDDSESGLPRYLCNQCGISFTSRGLLKIHVRNKHENKFSYNCDVCGKGFEGKNSFESHMKTHDKNRTKDYVCSFCGVGYNYRNSLHIHMARIHPDQTSYRSSSIKRSKPEKPGIHKCRWCNEVFPFKYLLVNHVPVVHKDLYKFSCDMCDKAYIGASSLRLHKEISHSDGTLRFSCEYCGKAFVHKHNVTSHYKYCAVKKKGISPATATASTAPHEYQYQSSTENSLDLDVKDFEMS